MRTHDLVIRGGTVVDGTRADPRAGFDGTHSHNVGRATWDALPGRLVRAFRPAPKGATR